MDIIYPLPEQKASLPHRRSDEVGLNANEQKLLWQEVQSLRRAVNSLITHIKETNPNGQT